MVESSASTLTVAPGQSQHTQRWIQDEWPRIKFQLLREFGWQIIIDPEFSEPGTALYHCPRIVGKGRVSVPEEYSEETAWDVTPLPASTASQVAARLGKGCLFQPIKTPSVSYVGPQLEQIDPDLSLDKGPQLKFFHKIGKDTYNFQTWEAFLRFINRKDILVDLTQCPDDVKERLESFDYRCYQHNFCTNNKHQAEQHIRAIRYSMKRGRTIHLSLDELIAPKETDKTAGNIKAESEAEEEKTNG